MADVTWPDILSPSAGGMPIPVFANVAGPTSADGMAQVVATDAGFWKMTMASVPLFDPATWRAWNATALKLNGRANSCLIPIFNRHTANWPNVYRSRRSKPPKVGPNASGALIWATIEANLAQGGVGATIRLKHGSALQEGVFFSVAERLYSVKAMGVMTRDGNDRLYPVTLWPPAREAIAAGTRLEFDRPTFRARLATDAEMEQDRDPASMGARDVNWLEDT